MAKLTKRRLPTLRQQVFKIARGVSEALTILKTQVLPLMETKENAERRYRELRREFKSEIGVLREELREKPSIKQLNSEIKALADHVHGLFERHNESHQKINERLVALESAGRGRT